MSSPTNQDKLTDANVSDELTDKPTAGTPASEPGVVEPGRNHQPSRDHPTAGMGAPSTPRPCPSPPIDEDDVTVDDIDNILGVAIGFFDLPRPLDDAAHARLHVMIATLPDRELRAAFIALVDSLPEVPQPVIRMLAPASGAETTPWGFGTQCSGKWCSRCWVRDRSANRRRAANTEE
ncbi:hypothetical protein DICSQDRAFT_124820 [Dichomitus squalens LYAD-421 SS1]|uniref:uncharacterized protein n=1 Tax=Dichomitus squalens (strain LYAD-421) TaxID=732165 RepID=UPI000441237F|nr:uncharacterized protein DICSQDRAFT_124820 [Dichomitus squalens LYAD-421 SS1]EJF64594.1 hypothetical protein DICSQDRAFT_124820 [Dichomitus squalens LYAD-421 SS1]